MHPKKPEPAFEVLLRGPTVYPEQIPVSSLARTLSAVQRLSAGIEAEDEEADEEKHPEEATIRLLDVRRGSAIFQCVAGSPELALTHLRQVGKMLESPDENGAAEIDYAFRPIDELSHIAGTLNCSIIIRRNRSDVLATIEKDSYERVSRSLLVSGDTTVIGSVQRVGGATDMRCALRVPFQKRLLYCDVEFPSVARQLGQHLYEEIAATGSAKWVQRSWRLHAFTIRLIHQPEPGKLVQAMAALREAGGKEWDKINDPERFLREIGARP